MNEFLKQRIKISDLKNFILILRIMQKLIENKFLVINSKILKEICAHLYFNLLSYNNWINQCLKSKWRSLHHGLCARVTLGQLRPCRMAQTAQSQRPTHSIVIRFRSKKKAFSKYSLIESEQIETSCFKYLNLIHFNLLVIKKKFT